MRNKPQNLTNKKPTPDFFVRLVGNIRPWSVPLRTLAKVLEATQRLAEPPSDEMPISEAVEDEDEQTIEEVVSGEDKPILRLLDIKKGSARYGVAGSPVAVTRLRSTGEAIERPSEADWSASQVRSIEELSAIAKSLKVRIEYVEGSLRDGDVIARITPETYNEIEVNAFIHGDTSVIGRIERVGGATKLHCGLRIADQSRMLICSIKNSDLARELGQHLYEVVVVSGKAQWLRKNWQIKRLQIRSFEPPKTASVFRSLSAARAAGGSAWDNIRDPEKYIADMRG